MEAKLLFEELVSQIKNFDPTTNTVSELRDRINKAQEMLSESEIEGVLQDYVDLTSLNSRPFPSFISGYPVWSMDHKGNCLVGEDLQTIEHYDDIALYLIK